MINVECMADGETEDIVKKDVIFDYSALFCASFTPPSIVP
jgi:hypothetical protein